MDRVNAFTIQLKDDQWDNADLLSLLFHTESFNERVIEDQPQFGDGIFWFNSEDIPLELFKHSNCFDWVSGVASIWLPNDDNLTKYNYKILVWDVEPTVESEGAFHYEYVDYTALTNIRPIIESLELQ